MSIEFWTWQAQSLTPIPLYSITLDMIDVLPLKLEGELVLLPG